MNFQTGWDRGGDIDNCSNNKYYCDSLYRMSLLLSYSYIYIIYMCTYNHERDQTDLMQRDIFSVREKYSENEVTKGDWHLHKSNLFLSIRGMVLVIKYIQTHFDLLVFSYENYNTCAIIYIVLVEREIERSIRIARISIMILKVLVGNIRG